MKRKITIDTNGLINGVHYNNEYIEDQYEIETLLTDSDLILNYIYNDGEITARPVLSISPTAAQIQANGTDTCIITGTPSGATITSNGTTMTTDGTDIEFVTDTPGEHKLQITLWPYQDAEVIINAI